MTKFYIKGATRYYPDNILDAWITAEENLGLKNSLFFHHKGKTTQWLDYEESEKLHKKIKKMDFDKVFEKYFKAIGDEDLVKQFECLAVFDELDNHPEIANEDILRRLKRVRENTHEAIYNLK